jgi:hypothetical protein
MNQGISDQTLGQHIEEYSKDQDKVMKDLTAAKYVSDEKPLKQKLQAITSVVSALVRYRSVRRAEAEKQT